MRGCRHQPGSSSYFARRNTQISLANLNRKPMVTTLNYAQPFQPVPRYIWIQYMSTDRNITNITPTSFLVYGFRQEEESTRIMWWCIIKHSAEQSALASDSHFSTTRHLLSSLQVSLITHLQSHDAFHGHLCKEGVVCMVSEVKSTYKYLSDTNCSFINQPCIPEVCKSVCISAQANRYNAIR